MCKSKTRKKSKIYYYVFVVNAIYLKRMIERDKKTRRQQKSLTKKEVEEVERQNGVLFTIDNR